MRVLILLTGILLSSNLLATVEHRLNVQLSPKQNSLKVVDQITFYENDCKSSLNFSLHEGLQPEIVGNSKAKLVFVSKTLDKKNDVNIEQYQLALSCDEKSVEMAYEGIIFHPVKVASDPYSRGTSDSPGLISEEGVVLSSSTYWYPQFENADFLNFEMKVSDDAGYTYMSQGQKIAANHFKEVTPQEEIYLIGARFSLYEKKLENNLLLSAYLRTPEDDLAKKYLDTTEGYLNRYSKLISPYPYVKFDLVENFWDTGFGMPSFTLLGSNIIRLPFIINTSYPHEILHDWWGNSVYVDYLRGNWCEGITVYMADHLTAELNQTSDVYRRDSLQKYTDFVTPKNDFPLTKFINRYSAPSEAIGYGKSLMFFHMLRLKLGDDVFRNGFAHFYDHNKFKKVSYEEIKNSLESVSGKNLTPEFNQWVKRTGAPQLKIVEAISSFNDSKYRLKIKLAQTQAEDVFSIELPIAITLEGKDQAVQKKVAMNSRELEMNLEFNERPVFLQVDPEFDVFRRLSTDEVPSVMTMSFGAKQTYFLIPSNTSAEERAAWNEFANTLKPALSKDSLVQIIDDSELKTVPSNSSVWVLGKKNNFVGLLNNSMKNQNVTVGNGQVAINGIQYPSDSNSFTFIGRDISLNTNLTFVDVNDLSLVTALANKLIHYGKYSYLVFNTDKLVNKLKGVWKLDKSSMSISVVQADGKVNITGPGKLLPRGPLAN